MFIILVHSNPSQTIATAQLYKCSAAVYMATLFGTTKMLLKCIQTFDFFHSLGKIYISNIIANNRLAFRWLFQPSHQKENIIISILAENNKQRFQLNSILDK